MKNKAIKYILIFTIFLFLIIVFIFNVDKKTNQKIITYINTFGWEIPEDPYEISYMKIPENFNQTFEQLNNILKNSNFDLTRYKNKNVTLYTYKVLNHKLSETSNIYITVIMLKNEIIGSVIYSDSKNNFIYEIENINEQISNKNIPHQNIPSQ